MQSGIEMKLVIGLNRVIQALNRKQNDFVSKYGLTLPQFGVLEALYFKGPMCVNDIIEKTLSTSGNMTVVIENLRKDEFVKKEKDIFDRRKFVISLTYKGKMLIEEIFDKHAENTVEFFDDMKKNEERELLALLLKLRSEK